MYIHQHICISPQDTSDLVNPDNIRPSVEGKLIALEPALDGVPPGMLRRMSKAVRMGMGAGLPLLKSHTVDGIVIGTANGGMEDCIKFLNQIVDYEEGLLTPAHFVQSTPNAIAGLQSLLTQNRSYNATHVHQGLAFENALLDAGMLVAENPGKNILVGGVDEISTYNYNIDLLAGWYSKTKSNAHLFDAKTPHTIAGEGAAMFIVSDQAADAAGNLEQLEFFHSQDTATVTDRFRHFIADFVPVTDNTILISGENGDGRQLPLYVECEEALGSALPVVRYKHLSGEYPTASSFALWLACQALQQQGLPRHLFKNEHSLQAIDRVILYNQYQGKQHSFMLVSK